jgi:hypothetical protein
VSGSRATGKGDTPNVTSRRPRISFGIIVLNGEPFTRYCLRSLYPFAHEIIVVEGAAPGAANVSRPDGHSADGTLEVLREFRSVEDPLDRVRIVTAEDEGHVDGFWPGEKDEQSRAYARRATGDYLWQVDIDEFYTESNMSLVLRLLADDPSITAASFMMMMFWGGLDYRVDGWYQWRGGNCFHRLFRWGPGYQYAKHRPPTVLDDRGRDLRSLKWLDGAATDRLGVRLFHYSLLFPEQVRAKAEYLRNAPHSRTRAIEMQTWMADSYFSLTRPYRVHSVYAEPSWLERYNGPHPTEVLRMMDDIRAGRTSAALRPTEDVDALLRSWWYPMGRGFYKALFPASVGARRARALVQRARRVISDPRAALARYRARA